MPRYCKIVKSILDRVNSPRYSVAIVAEKLNVSQRRVYQLIERGYLKAEKVLQGKYEILQYDLDEYLATKPKRSKQNTTSRIYQRLKKLLAKQTAAQTERFLILLDQKVKEEYRNA